MSKMNFVNNSFVLLVVSVLVCAAPPKTIRNANSPVESRNATSRETLEEYLASRKDFVDRELKMSYGWELELNEIEQCVNEVLMEAKNKDFDEGMKDPSKFLASQHFFLGIL